MSVISNSFLPIPKFYIFLLFNSLTTSYPNCPLTPVTNIIIPPPYNIPFLANLIIYLNIKFGIKGNIISINIDSL